MTRDEIRQQLKDENPSSNIDGVIYGPGDAAYESLIDRWTDAKLASIATPKRWPDTEHFLSEFTPEEMAGIGLSVDPTVAGLRFLLSGWRSAVHSDDPRVVQGLNALVAAGIISEHRKAEILR